MIATIVVDANINPASYTYNGFSEIVAMSIALIVLGFVLVYIQKRFGW